MTVNTLMQLVIPFEMPHLETRGRRTRHVQDTCEVGSVSTPAVGLATDVLQKEQVWGEYT